MSDSTLVSAGTDTRKSIKPSVIGACGYWRRGLTGWLEGILHLSKVVYCLLHTFVSQLLEDVLLSRRCSLACFIDSRLRLVPAHQISSTENNNWIRHYCNSSLRERSSTVHAHPVRRRRTVSAARLHDDQQVLLRYNCRRQAAVQPA